MKKLILFFAICLFGCPLLGQTLYVPGGTATGIGSSANGNVGIGVETPTSRLEVKKSLFSSDLSGQSSLNSLNLHLHTYDGFFPPNVENRLLFSTQSYRNEPKVTGAIAAAVEENGGGKYGGGRLVFYTRAAAPGGGQSPGLIEQMRINREGNVGIGTTNPGSYKLAVEGKIGAREVNVTTAAWADFVFKENYALRPLEDVEHFIQQNGHLPDVPSEADVLEKGIDLGAMDAKLLQKIEELTLYLIEMKKENEVLKERIEILETTGR